MTSANLASDTPFKTALEEVLDRHVETMRDVIVKRNAEGKDGTRSEWLEPYGNLFCYYALVQFEKGAADPLEGFTEFYNQQNFPSYKKNTTINDLERTGNIRKRVEAVIAAVQETGLEAMLAANE